MIGQTTDNLSEAIAVTVYGGDFYFMIDVLISLKEKSFTLELSPKSSYTASTIYEESLENLATLPNRSRVLCKSRRPCSYHLLDSISGFQLLMPGVERWELRRHAVLGSH